MSNAHSENKKKGKHCTGTAEAMNLQSILEKELERLKCKLQMGHELKVVWVPRNDSKLAGEVRGVTVFIYEETEEEAIATLGHEFLDYSISKIVEPYKEVTNKLITLINEQAYRKKERLVENLRSLIYET